MIDDKYLISFLRDPVNARNTLLDLPIQYTVEPIFHGANMFVHVTGICNVACEHCMYSSDYTKSLPKPSLTDADIKLAIKYLNDSNPEKLTISGGGEPFLELNKVLTLVSNVNSKQIEIVTAADWATSSEDTRIVLHQLNAAIQLNSSQPKVLLRVSIDKFHSIAKNPVAIENYAFLLQEWQNEDFLFEIGLRGLLLEDDVTPFHLVERIGAKLEVIDDWNKKLILSNNKEVPYTFNVMRFSGKAEKYQNKLKHKTKSLLEYYKPFNDENGNLVLGMIINDAIKGQYYKTQGLSITVDYDGSIFIFAATSPDRFSSLEQHTFKESVKYFYRDPITQILLQDGIYKVIEIVSYLNERLVELPISKNDIVTLIRDLLSNSFVRLYVTLVCIKMLIDKSLISNYLDFPLLLDIAARSHVSIVEVCKQIYHE